MTPVLGISSNFMHADPQRALFKGKTLQYLEERLALALWRAGAVPVLLPDLQDGPADEALLDRVDGLVLAGGADVSPSSYGEVAIEPRWAGDAIRDRYETRLLHGALARRMPVLGVCRGLQLANVALGGTLWQDLGTQRDASLVHRDWDRYDELAHPVRLEADAWVSRAYDGATELAVNSVHHQAVKELAAPLRATAWSPDGVVEAAEWIDGDHMLVAVQWHPEWLEREGEPSVRADGRHCGDAVFAAFVSACRG